MPAPPPPGIPPEGRRAAGRVSLCPAVRFASKKNVRRRLRREPPAMRPAAGWTNVTNPVWTSIERLF